MEYIVEKNGKLRFATKPDVHFNLSHSKNMSLAVVSDEPVGCDIQFVDKVDEKLYDLVLSEEEKKYVVGASVNSVGVSVNSVGASCTSPEERFYELWAMKEAIIKKDGSGLRDRLTDVHDDNVYIEKIVLSSNEVTEKYVVAII